MDVIIFVILLLVVVGIVCTIAYSVPYPPPLAWLRWVIPCLALLVALVLILERWPLLR